MPDIEVTRRTAEEDVAPIVALARTVESHDGHPPLGEHKWLDLVQGGRTGVAGFVARDRQSGRLVGYSQLSHGKGSWAVELVVHPAWRGEDNGVAIALLRQALDEVAAHGGGHLHLWVPKPEAGEDAVAAAVGLSRGRELYQMRRRLPLEEALRAINPLATRPFRPGEDDEAWLALNNRAFAAHPEQGSWDRATLAERMAQPWFDPARFLLYEEEGALVGFCWIKVHDDPRRGEIYVIGVDPDRHGGGLGKRLLVAGISSIEAAGLDEVMLYVDADNAPAVALYRHFGFHIDHHDRAYVADVAPRP